MSVATKNPFALLDDEDPSRPSSPTPAPADAAPPAPPAATRGSQKLRGGPAARGGKYYQRGGGTNKSGPKDVNQNQNGAEEPVPVAEGQRKFENRGRGRGGRGGPNTGTRGRRPFDRHSQTGKTDSDKRIHQSWGGDDGETERKVEEAANTDVAAEEADSGWNADPAPAPASGWGAEPAPVADWGGDAAPVADWGTPGPTAGDTPAGDAAAEGDKPEREGRPRREREPEEEDNTLTLDQYLAQKKEKESVVPKLEGTRQANEGADASTWKDVVPLNKNEEDDAYFIGKAKSAPKARNKKEEKVFIEIDVRFERPDRGRGRGRGGDRGSDRGDRGRGGRGRGGGVARGGRQPGATPVVNVDDQAAFPSLA